MIGEKISMKRVYLALAVLLTSLILCSCENTNAEWQEQFDLGTRYLAEHNYVDAEIAFAKAIEIDPKRAEAYIGRGDAFMAHANYQDAQADYETALELGREIEHYLKLSNGMVAQGQIDDAIELLKSAINDIQDDGRLQERISALQNVGGVNGSVYEWNHGLTDKPIDGAIVTLLKNDTNEVELSFRTQPDGTFNGYAIAGDYDFFVHAEKYLPVELNESVTEGHVRQIENIFLLKSDDGQSGNIEGITASAVTGEALPNVSVWYEQGWKATPSEEHDETLTQEDGKYEFLSVTPGYYTVFAEKDGYVTSFIHTVASDNGGGQITLSPILSDTELRIVLTWGEEPEDLDAHLAVNSASFASAFMTQSDVYFSNMVMNVGDTSILLDVDDTNSFGPETITVSNYVGQKYVYAIHDYTNKDNPFSHALAESGASVTVYNGSTVIGTFHVPSNVQGNIWEVFALDETGAFIETGGMKAFRYDMGHDEFGNEDGSYSIYGENNELLQYVVHEHDDNWSYNVYRTYDGQGNLIQSSEYNNEENIIRDADDNIIQYRVYSETGYTCYDADHNVLWEREYDEDM